MAEEDANSAWKPISFLEPLTKPDATEDVVDEKVKFLIKNTEDVAHQEALDDLAYTVTNGLFDVVEKTPFQDQKKLVEFVVKLQQATAYSKNKESLKSHGLVLWTELPTFGWEARDRWNFEPGQLLDYLRSDQENSKTQKYNNLAAFLARLTVVAHTKCVMELDFSLFALWDLRSAFEEEYEAETKALPEHAYATGAILQASVWMLHCPDVIRDHCKEQKNFPDRNGVAGKKYELEHDWKGYNEERWRIWKAGFQDAQSWVVGDSVKAKIGAVVERIAHL